MILSEKEIAKRKVEMFKQKKKKKKKSVRFFFKHEIYNLVNI